MIDKNIKSILIIKLRGIGDVVLSTIVLDNLKQYFPVAQIDYLTDLSSKPVVDGLPQVNSVITFPKDSLFERIKLIYKIFRKKYDLVLDYFSNPSTALITYLSKAKFRVGFPYRGRKYAYNLFGPAERGKYHSAILHLKTLENIGIDTPYKNLYFYISEDDIKFADNFFNSQNLSNKFVVGISPSGGWKSKKCDPEKFSEIANSLKNKYNCEILILWGPGDFDDASLINKLVPGSIIAPKSNINQMGALIRKCDVLIANDSGPMHISTAVGTPVLSLHGPTNPYHQGPFGSQHEFIILENLDCIMCNLLNCPKNHECFKNIDVEIILNKFDILLNKNRIRK